MKLGTQPQPGMLGGGVDKDPFSRAFGTVYRTINMSTSMLIAGLFLDLPGTPPCLSDT